MSAKYTVLLIIILVIVGVGVWYFWLGGNQTAENAIPSPTPSSGYTGGTPSTTVSGTSSGASSTASSSAASFNVTGQNFSFSLKEIRVKKGAMVTINFTSQGGTHDWVVDEFNARTKRVGSGQSDSIQFVADKTGTFQYYCSVGTHRQMGMVGNLIITE